MAGLSNWRIATTYNVQQTSNLKLFYYFCLDEPLEKYHQKSHLTGWSNIRLVTGGIPLLNSITC
jgi:hypothetical protein